MFAVDSILYSVLICINFVNLNLMLYYMYYLVDAGKLKNLDPFPQTDRTSVNDMECWGAGERAGCRDNTALTCSFLFLHFLFFFWEYTVLMDRFQNFKHIYIVLIFF